MRRRGFTLIEVTVTVVVLTVLFALGTVVWGVYRGRVSDGEARHSLRTVAADAQARYTSRGEFLALPAGQSAAAALASAFPGLSFTTASATGAKTISWDVGTLDGAPVLALAAKGASGCLTVVVRDPALGKATEADNGPCDATARLDAGSGMP